MSSFIKYYDDRYGDFYEIYYDETTGDFEGARRSVGGIGNDPIYYDFLSELPPFHRNQIEHLLWIKLHPTSKSQESSPPDGSSPTSSP